MSGRQASDLEGRRQTVYMNEQLRAHQYHQLRTQHLTWAVPATMPRTPRLDRSISPRSHAGQFERPASPRSILTDTRQASLEPPSSWPLTSADLPALLGSTKGSSTLERVAGSRSSTPRSSRSGPAHDEDLRGSRAGNATAGETATPLSLRTARGQRRLAGLTTAGPLSAPTVLAEQAELAAHPWTANGDHVRGVTFGGPIIKPHNAGRTGYETRRPFKWGQLGGWDY